MSGCIYNVDTGLAAMVIVPFDRSTLRQNRDAAFFFQIVRIHCAFFDALVVAESTGLTEKLIDKGGFAMIDVGDNRYIAKRHIL